METSPTSIVKTRSNLVLCSCKLVTYFKVLDLATWCEHSSLFSRKGGKSVYKIGRQGPKRFPRLNIELRFHFSSDVTFFKKIQGILTEVESAVHLTSLY